MNLRYVILLASLGLVWAACGGAAEPVAVAEATSTSLSTSTPAASTAELSAGALAALEGGSPSALDTFRSGLSDEFPEPLIDIADIGTVIPPDVIPSIDDPQFVDIAAADTYLTDDEPVVYLEVDGDARAYPVQILIWHEIVNDVVAGQPVAVTYCPLCNSAVSYSRVIGDTEVTFGTSGSLYNSALVMYDRVTESLWTHYDGRAVVGALTGVRLEPISSPLIAWADFKAQFPEGIVLDRDRTGASRAYGTNPYVGYDDATSAPFLFRGDADDRAQMLRRVVGVTIGEDAKGWTLDSLMDGELSATAGSVGETELVIFWKAGQSSALDTGAVDGGRDVGSVAVFIPEVDGRALTFSVSDGAFTDAETGSEWSITGQAFSGELADTQLERVPHLDTFWFAWSSYQSGTELVEG